METIDELTVQGCFVRGVAGALDDRGHIDLFGESAFEGEPQVDSLDRVLVERDDNKECDNQSGAKQRPEQNPALRP